MEIKIGIGLGDILFGCGEHIVTDLLGPPESVDEFEYEQGSGYFTRVLTYHGDGLSFSFDSDDNYRLCTITIREQGHSVFGRLLAGESVDDVTAFLTELLGEFPVVDHAADMSMPGYTLVEYEEHSLSLWFDHSGLVDFQFGYLFDGDDEPVWPE